MHRWTSLKLNIDLRHLGQTTTVERSTLAQVREKIAALRAATSEKASAKSFDFDQRLAEIRDNEEKRRQQVKEEKKAARIRQQETLPVTEEDLEMTHAMGFAGFGSTKKA